MVREFRIFFPLGTNAPTLCQSNVLQRFFGVDAKTADTFSNELKASDVEQRQDIYYVLQGPAGRRVGIKLRGEDRSLEVKICTPSDVAVNEAWDKLKVNGKFESSGAPEILSAVVAAMEHVQGIDGILSSVREALNSPIAVAVVDKARRSEKLDGVATFEETDCRIHLTFLDRAVDVSVRSWAAEKKHHLEEFDSMVRRASEQAMQGIKGCVVAGYPAFLQSLVAGGCTNASSL